MKINKDSLKARTVNLSNKLNITQNTIYYRYFFDEFLSRLVISEYKNNFILKGGLYLSSILGIDNRATIDIDFYINKIRLEKEIIFSTIKFIANINIDDGIKFDVNKIIDIRKNNEYGGFQISMIGKLQNIRCEFLIDIVTGDPITPSEQTYKYECLVTKEILPLKVYSLESVVSEKLETVFSRQIVNSRSKDYYDLYILRKTQLVNIDSTLLKKAFLNTCKYRNLVISKEEALALLNNIKSNNETNLRWLAFTRKAEYAKDVEFCDVIQTIIDWVEDIFN